MRSGDPVDLCLMVKEIFFHAVKSEFMETLNGAIRILEVAYAELERNESVSCGVKKKL